MVSSYGFRDDIVSARVKRVEKACQAIGSRDLEQRRASMTSISLVRVFTFVVKKLGFPTVVVTLVVKKSHVFPVVV